MSINESVNDILNMSANEFISIINNKCDSLIIRKVPFIITSFNSNIRVTYLKYRSNFANDTIPKHTLIYIIDHNSLMLSLMRIVNEQYNDVNIKFNKLILNDISFKIYQFGHYIRNYINESIKWSPHKVYTPYIIVMYTADGHHYEFSNYSPSPLT